MEFQEIKNRRIIFISHDASQTGAPVLLLNLLRFLKGIEYKNITIVLGRGGELESKFREIGQVFVFRGPHYGQRNYLISKLVDYFFLFFRKIQLFFLFAKCDFVFSNTIANGRILKYVSVLKKPTVLYVHELQSVIQDFDKDKDSSLSLRFAEIVVCPSKAVAENLAINYLIPYSRIMYLRYYFPAVLSDEKQLSKLSAKQVFSEKYGTPLDAFWVVGMGNATLRKGVDIFVEICEKVASIDDKIQFVWIGEFLDDNFKNDIVNNVLTKKIGDKILFTGKVKHDILNLLPFDLFALTSREDPYPLVVIEAAYNKIPAVCFSDSGGIVEFLDDNCGWGIPDFSNDEMSRKIVNVKTDEVALRVAGDNAFKKANNWHSNQGQINIQFEAIIGTLKL